MKNLSSKLDNSYYAVQSITVIISVNILRRVYCATLHSHLQSPHSLWDEVMGEVKQFLK